MTEWPERFTLYCAGADTKVTHERVDLWSVGVDRHADPPMIEHDPAGTPAITGGAELGDVLRAADRLTQRVHICTMCGAELRVHDADHGQVVVDFIEAGVLDVELALFRTRYRQSEPWKRRV
jgi:hypothetical protein